MLTASEWHRIRSSDSVAKPEWRKRGEVRACGGDPNGWPTWKRLGGRGIPVRRGPIGIVRNVADPIAPKKTDKGAIPVVVQHGTKLPAGDHVCLAVGTAHDVVIGKGRARRAAGWVVIATFPTNGERPDIPDDHPARRFGIAWLHVDSIKPIGYVEAKEVTR